MKIAVEGCAHGELDVIYDTIAHLENEENIKIDLVICCGDFQATRNVKDLKCMAIPSKYHSMCSFYKYYSGEKIAPILTIFIGGNHEASNYLQELAYGGWVAPNIYYMGYANVINIAGVRIGGISGIYKGHDYMKGHFEKPPYSEDTRRSAYHIRSLEVFRMKQLKQPLDIFLSHDWPRGIHRYGNEQRLLKQKPFFQQDINTNSLGSKPCEELLHHLKPSYWFAAHLHVRFAAIVVHKSDSSNEEKTTKFLALDKCLPRRKFLQVLDIPHDTTKPIELEYDIEWLSVLHLTNHLLSIKKNMQFMPGPGGINERWDFTPTEEELAETREKFGNNLCIPKNFTQTVDAYSLNDSDLMAYATQPPAQINPQTMAFCEQLGIDDPMAMLLKCSGNNSFTNSITSTCTPPSFLTPERPGDVSHISFCMNDSDCELDATEVDSTSKDSSLSHSKESVSSLPMRRLSLALPSPQNSDIDEPLAKAVNEENPMSPINNEIESLGACLLSPKDSDAEDLNTTCNDNSSFNSSTVDDPGSGKRKVHNETQPEISPGTRKFKRRNQAFYSSTDEDC